MLENLFTNVSAIRLIEHLILHEQWNQSINEICKMFQIKRMDLVKIMENLNFYGIVSLNHKTREISINKSSKIVLHIRVLMDLITEKELLFDENDFKGKV